MKIFVTGASGFIGSHVTKTLLSRGHSLLAMIPPEEVPWRIEDILKKIHVIKGKLEDLGIVRQALKEFQPEACIHLAWYAEPGKYLTSPENLNCLKTSLDLFQELIQAGCKQIAAAGTCAEYAPSGSLLKEDSPAAPATLYAAAKLSCGLMGRQLADLAKIQFAWGRIFFPYGPGEDARRVVPAVIRTLLKSEIFQATDGEQVRDYIHVQDIAEAFCLMAEKGADGVFNISSGKPLTIRRLLETAGHCTGKENLIRFGAVPYRAWEPPFLCGDSGRLAGLGWKPRMALEDGLRETVQWWINHVSY